MRKLRWFSALAALALAACGGGGSCSGSFAGTCGTGPGTGSNVASVLLVSDSSTIPSDNSKAANLTAFVRDANNNFVANIPVVFTSSSGGIGVTQATTDVNGVATATVNTLADKTNRTITITATADTIVATATVDVVGTTLQIQGPASLTSGQQGTYTVTLNDSGGNGIGGTALTVQAPAGLTVASTSLTTSNLGQATFNATGGASGSGALTVTGLGLTASLTVTINGNALTVTASNTTIPLNTSQTFTAHYAVNGVAQAGAPLNFATTRGCINPAGTTCVGQLSTATVNTNANGDASVSVLSDNAGGATVTASAVSGTSGQITAQFIATLAASIDVQPSIFTLAPNSPPATDQQSTITAIVRDANNNLVTGSTVAFSLNDVTGGTLSVGSAVTDLQGRAQSVYTAGSITSAANGVHVTATVQGTAVPPKTVDLTVAKRQVFISIGTGNAIIANASATQYEKDYIVQVTDSNGAGVKGVPLSLSVLSNWYFKGYRKFFATVWGTCYTFPSDTCAGGAPVAATIANGCADEDINRNGILDPGENQNGINPATGTATLEAGNIALVSPSSATTDSNGFALVSVFYPEEYAYYLQVTLQVQASVSGTAYSAQSVFMLPGLADDFNSQTKAPPGPVSPFGTSNSCTDML